MANEHEEVLDEAVETPEEEVEINLEEEVEEVKETPAKPVESLEARRARLQRQLDQTEKKMGLSTKKKEVQDSTPNNLGESAFLIANGIKDSDERNLAKKLAKETGKDLESLLETTYFQSELSSLRESKTTANATPKGSKRANNSSVDSVEYWIAKNELPPVSEIKLRQDVVNARIKREETKSQFYNS